MICQDLTVNLTFTFMIMPGEFSKERNDTSTDETKNKIKDKGKKEEILRQPVNPHIRLTQAVNKIQVKQIRIQVYSDARDKETIIINI